VGFLSRQISLDRTRVLADVELDLIVYVQFLTTCVHRAGDFVLAAKKEPSASIAWGDHQVGLYGEWFHGVASVRLFVVFYVSSRMSGLMPEVSESKIVVWTLVALFVD